MVWHGGRVQSCVRPVAAVHMTAGPDGMRGYSHVDADAYANTDAYPRANGCASLVYCPSVFIDPVPGGRDTRPRHQ